jgi:hypothetical protein
METRHGGRLGKKAEEVVPYKILPIAVESVKQVALSRCRA